MSTTTKHLKKVEITGFRRIKAATFTPGATRIEITGPNRAGKSSICDAIEAALGNHGAAGNDPIHEGEREAVVRLHIGATEVETIVTQTWTEKDGKVSRKLAVKTLGWDPNGSPTDILKGITGGQRFNAEDFLRAPEAKRLEIMRRFVPGFDFDEAARRRKRVFDDRTDAGRDVKRLAGAVEEQRARLPIVPAGTRSAAAIMAEMQAAMVVNNEITEARGRRKADETRRDTLAGEEGRFLAEAESLESRALLMRDNATSARRQIDALNAKLFTFEEQPEPVDVSALQEEMRGAEKITALAAAQEQLDRIMAEHKRADDKHKALDQQLADGDKAMRAAIDAAEFPVPGLSVTEEDVLLNGHPFAQASTREQLHVAVALFVAANPGLRVLILRDGNAWDAAGMAILDELAEQHDFQIICERVSEADDEHGQNCVVVVDGTVVRETGATGPKRTRRASR